MAKLNTLELLWPWRVVFVVCLLVIPVHQALSVPVPLPLILCQTFVAGIHGFQQASLKTHKYTISCPNTHPAFPFLSYVEERCSRLDMPNKSGLELESIKWKCSGYPSSPASFMVFVQKCYLFHSHLQWNLCIYTNQHHYRVGKNEIFPKC